MTQNYTSQRPALADRKFTSPAVEKTLQAVKAQIADPELAWLFENCYPNTLDTTVRFRPDGGEGGGPDTFVITGDIDAMWLRDSTAQVWPFLPLVGQDPQLQQLFAGVIRRQCTCILYDPYANAFMGSPEEKTQWVSDHAQMLPGIHERKWEIDSLCYPLRLAHGYWMQTRDASPMDARWEQAMALVLQTFRQQQRREGDGPYYFHRDEPGEPRTSRSPSGEPIPDFGPPVQPNGLICSRFRPSDDAVTYQYLIPSNFFAAAALRQMAELLREVRHNAEMAAEADALADEVSAALAQHARAEHPDFGTIYPYEMDGRGGVLLMDDANVPSLLSLPYLGACDPADPVYQATRRFVWSCSEPVVCGRASTPASAARIPGPNTIWPIALSMYALTSSSETEVAAVIAALKATHAGTGFMHESFDASNPDNFSRTWFAWANSLFGEMIVQTAARFPHLLG